MADTQPHAWVIDQAFYDLAEAIPDVFFLKDGAGRWIVANAAARDLLDLHQVEWQGKTDQELAEMRPQMAIVHQKCLEDDDLTWDAGKLQVFEKRLINDTGCVCDYEVRKSPIFDQNGERKGLITIGRNITNQKLAEQNMRIADTAFDSLEAIIITDADKRILRVNNSFTRLTGYKPEDVVGKTPAILKSGRHDAAFYQAMWKTLQDKKVWRGEIWDKRKNGEIYPKWMTISAVTTNEGEVQNYVGTFNDLSGQMDAREAIHRLAFYDALTDLPNRRMLMDRLSNALANSECSQHYGAILMLDLDNFKLINDTKGHVIGDSLLIEVARRLKECVREEDTVARLGGDEFVVLLEFLSQEAEHAARQAQTVAEKILREINQSFSITGHILHSTLSIGISMFTFPSVTSEEMLKRADTAMYQAKAAGRNTLCFFDPGLQALLEKRINIESELRQAVQKNQFQLYFQAQVNHTGQTLGAEVLLRWSHPEEGLIPPDDFIPLAEESGLILPIGEWVLRTACKQLTVWESNPLTSNLTLAVNVSAKQFNQVNFVAQVKDALALTGAKASLLKLELTETLVLNNISDTIDKMEALRLLGIRFSIDDFGTGHSSLSYLKKLPISQLKIDRSFVRDIFTDPNDAVITQTIIGMAKNFGLDVIAEGVETEDQRASLESYGCYTYQGYLFGKPVPLEDFEKILKISK